MYIKNRAANLDTERNSHYANEKENLFCPARRRNKSVRSAGAEDQQISKEDIMKRKLTAMTALILAILLILSFPALGEQAANAFDPETDPLLSGVVEQAAKFHVYHIGYPVNQDIRLEGFYDWYEKNEVGKAMLNNAGDPNTDGTDHGALKVETAVLRFFAPFYGFDPDNMWGLVSASGTDGNNHGIYFGRHYLESKTNMKPILYVSSESHYSNMRLGELQQLETRLIPTDEMGRMIPEKLKASMDPMRPALVVFSMGTTFKGGIDDQAALNKVIAEVNPPAVYRHVDAALFGGYLPFTEYADLVNREVCGFDSIAISGHKFFGIDEPCGLFFTTKDVLGEQNPYKISYLNASMPMINCSRSALCPLKFYWIIKTEGEEGLRAQAKEMLDNTAYLKGKLEEIGWPCWMSDAASNTIFFNQPDAETMEKYSLAPDYDERFGGDLAHVIIMQNATREILDEFVEDLKKQMEEEALAPAA